MRLIDADALGRYLNDCNFAENTKVGREREYETMSRVLRCIENAPTVDAVQVVRCKDCRWGKEACGNIECNVDLNLPSEYHGYEWFCPNGERKDDEQR